jgi:hypothetical protein
MGSGMRNPKFQAPNVKQSQITKLQMFQNGSACLTMQPVAFDYLNLGICLGFGY